MRSALTTILVFTTVLFASQGHAQSEKGNSFLSLSGGPSFVSGNFVATTYADPTAGFAEAMGLNLQLQGGYYLADHLALGMALSSSVYSLTGLKNMADGYLNDFDVDSTTLTVTGKYRSWNIVVGPTYTLPVKKFAFDAHLLAGVTLLQVPEFRVDLEDNTDATFYQKAATGAGFGLQAGIGVRYFVTEKIAVQLGADYLLAKPEVTITNENRTNNAGRLLTSYKQSVGGVTARLGISVVL